MGGGRALTSAAAGVLAGVVVVAGLAVFYAVTTTAPGARDHVVVCSGRFFPTVRYDGPESGFLSETYGVAPAYCESESLVPLSDFSLPIFLHNEDGGAGHVVQRLTMTYPFVLLSVAPSLPATIAAGGNLTLDVGFQSPGSPGDYTPSGTLTVG
jgi:hypothetical protein